MQNVIFKLKNEITSSLTSEEYDIDHLQSRVQNVLDLVLRCSELYYVNSVSIRFLKQANAVLLLNIESSSTSCYTLPTTKTGKKGRPSFTITKTQLEMYLENGFTLPDISKMICVSTSTVKRRLKKFNLSVGQTYTNISNDNLDSSITKIIGNFPNCGYRRMNGLLLASSIKVGEKRIRESMRRVDPNGVLLRALQISVTNRRQYKVPGILALWHIDGHHKLIRYAKSQNKILVEYDCSNFN